MIKYWDKLKRNIEGLIKKWEYSSRSRDRNIWVFGEWFGDRCCDNSMYFANYVIEHFPDIQVYWATKDNVDLSALNIRIQKLQWDSKEALQVYAKAGVAVMNQGFCDFSTKGFNYFDGAITLNLWHGVMWKHIGHDAGKESDLLHQIYRKFYDKLNNATNYLALSEDYAKICETAWNAEPEQIIKAGYPRNSIFYQPKCLIDAQKHVISALEKKSGLQWDKNVKIITYMPTFRDKARNTFSIEELHSNKKFMKWLEDNNIIIVQKAHFVTSKWRHELEQTGKEKRIFSLNDVPAQELMAATDLLITDYSSCFFDFLLLDRPIIHFIYDYDYYANQDRGLYYKAEDVICGDACKTKEELVNLIIQNIENPGKDHKLRLERKQKFLTYEGSNSCGVIYQKIRDLQSKREGIN